MIDINATDFMKTFKLENATIGIVGHGFVGKAMHEFFGGKCKVLINDKAKPELQSLKDVVAGSEVMFVCIPTPMRKDGSCYTGYVEEVLAQIRQISAEIRRNLDSFVVVIKSTVYPGFIEDMQNKHLPMRLVFSPEFLTEKNSVSDMKNANRIIVGGDEDDALVVCKYLAEVDPSKLEDGKRVLLHTDPTTAEMVKLYANGMLAAKVMLSNEVYQVCQKLGVNFEEVRTLATLDQRIGSGHTMVPGHDGDLGFGGHCLPKDVNNLRAVCRDVGVHEKMLTAMIERNEELRKNKDWMEMHERAVTEN